MRFLITHLGLIRIGLITTTIFTLTRFGVFGTNDIYLNDNSFIKYKDIRYNNRIIYTEIKWDLDVNKYYLMSNEKLSFSSIRPVNVYLNWVKQ